MEEPIEEVRPTKVEAKTLAIQTQWFLLLFIQKVSNRDIIFFTDDLIWSKVHAVLVVHAEHPI